jgi:adenylate cyclase
MQTAIDALKRFLGELRRRKVVRAGMAYAVIAWLVLQIGEVTFEPLGIPQTALSVLIVLAAFGLPAVLVLAWVYELTGDGLRRETEASVTKGAEAEPRAAPALPVADDPTRARSIAVMPFLDLSVTQDQAHFCDGIAEEIMNTLGRIPDLRVASRTSSFRFRGEATDIRAIGRELEVDSVLEGSVRKSGERLRILAQLTDVGNGYQLWSRRFEAESGDLFAIQDDIARSIAEALRVELNLDQQSARRAATSQDSQAYALYLRGWSYFHRHGRKNWHFARQVFEEAITIDPGFARAWAGLADCHAFLYMYAEPDPVHREKAKNASKRAQRLAPDLAEAHVSRALAHSLYSEIVLAEREFDAAVQLEPCLFEAWYFYGRLRLHQGSFAAAAQMFERASKCRPDDYQTPLLLRQIYLALGRQAEAGDVARRGLELAERALRMNPDDVRALYLSCGALLALGRPDEARANAERALSIAPDDGGVLYNLACFYALAGASDRALDFLEKAAIPAPQFLEWARTDPDLASLHAHPRFESLFPSGQQQPAAPAGFA